MNNENPKPPEAEKPEEPEVVVVKSEVRPEQPETPPANPAAETTGSNGNKEGEDLKPRLERLGGEPAPDITPEEFARLQQSGQIHIDPRGRVRSTTTAPEADAGVSLRKRRAWYGG
jgi:hypothetical protein